MKDKSIDTDQYTVGKVLGIWVLATLPMGLNIWVITPWLIPRVAMPPGFIYLILATASLVWQGVLCLLIVRREVRPLTWTGVKARLWLNAPLHPVSNAPAINRLWLTVPIALFLWAWDDIGIFSTLDQRWIEAIPFFAPPDYAQIRNLAAIVEGQWWLLVVILVLIVFNYLLGEELLFRGILLPKMNGAFGRFDWIANGVLFALYHVHMIWQLPSQILFRDWVYAWVGKRYRSFWMPAIVHGFDAIFLLLLVPMAIMGRYP
ncbi:MAG: CPBP family intramembrane glutamic endopeptidase [Casimicrobium sp.]